MANKKVSQLISKPAVNLTDLFLIADPTSGQAFKTTISDLGTAIGSGVSSVNTLVGAVVLDTDDIQELASPTNRWFTDTRARAALSASSPLAYNSGTGVFSIAQANGSTNGFLSSADWTTFNAKQTALNGTGFVKISGTTISYDNSTYLTTSAAASTYLALAGGTLTGALNGTSATFTGDLTLSATNPRLYFTDTDNNPDYFISNTDGTFTVYDVTNSTSRLTLTNLYTTLNNTVKIQGDILLNQDSTIGPVAGYTTIASDSSGIFLRLGTASSHAYLVLSGLTSFRNFTLPDATGTFALTSDLSAYLPLSGGTMSGAITTTNVYLTGMTAGSGALYYSSGSNRVTVANYNASGIVTFEVNGGNTALTLNSNLSATFASTLSATGATLTGALSGTTSTFTGKTTANVIHSSNGSDSDSGNFTGFIIGGSNAANARTASIIKNTSGDYDLIIRSQNATSVTTGSIIFQNGSTNHLTIASTGAATFSSSVLAQSDVESYNQFVISGGQLRIVNNGGQVGMNWTSGSAGDLYFRTASTERMRITNGGHVLINKTSSNGNRFQVQGDSYFDGQITAVLSNGLVRTSNADNAGMLHIRPNAGQSGYINWTENAVDDRWSIGVTAGDSNFYFRRFYPTSPAQMTLTGGGNLIVGDTTTNNTGKFTYVSPGVGAFNGVFEMFHSTTNNTSSGYVNFYVNNSVIGSINQNGASAVSYNTTSDYRLKEDLKPINGLEIVNKIKVYDYKWKAEDRRMDGVLAHELAEVLPYAVTGEKDGERMQGVDYSKIVPVLIQSIKELKSKIETLENK